MNNIVLTYLTLLLMSFSMFSQNQVSGVDLSKIKTLKDSLSFDNAVRDLRELIAEEQLDRAQTLSNQLVTIGNTIKYKKGLGLVYKEKGVIRNKQNNTIASDKNFLKATSYFQDIDYLEGLAIVCNERFIIEQSKGNFEKGADYLLEAKLYREQLKDSIGLSSIYNNLAIIYKELKNITSSEEYYIKSITLRRQLKLKGLGLVMNNLALLYTENGNLSKAKSLLPEALKINKQENDIRHTAQSYSIMAKVALYNENYQTAKKYYDTTLCVASQTNFKLLVINAKQQLGIIALKEREFNKAEELLKISRDEFSKVNAVPLLLKNYMFSFKLDSTRGNLLSAIHWQKKYQKLLDERMSDITAKKVEKTKSQYEAELEQLKLIEAQQERERETKAKLFQFRLIAYIAIVAVLVILTFLILIIRTRNERKRLITMLDNSNKVKNKLFSIIAHDLKNEINGLEGSLNLLKENSISEKEFKEIVPLLASGTHQTSILLHNLLNWSKSQLKELNANPTTFDISEVICDKFTFFEQKAQKKNIKLINNLNPTIIYADKDMFAIVAQNLIANAIKFCNSGDSIALLSEEKDDLFEICFKDTGIGIDPNHIHKLFAEDTYTTPGTQNESGTGLGLKICKELIELNQGKIEVKSTPGSGSIFCISLPKAA
ncbi:ATP-binding protein [Aquimarina mytili]|uniref:histidine kinase n=1 Tax=Aquimarina mytili TaxID=874423 RepID=A0A937D703_9FLAO|nr:tetratricopeptide repeat protein [Aquimarina mytili]MBL0682600.1 tetratricopeptide repeat protein [Aquimarina mytili]